MRGDGVIYGIEIDRSQEREVGPVVTFVMRLPNGVILTKQQEYDLRRYMVETIDRQVQTILESHDEIRHEISEAAGRRHLAKP